MSKNAEQVINGLIRYADSEIMGKLPTSGKWLMGTAITLATNKASNMIDVLMKNSIVKALGIVDENGMIDTDVLIDAMKSAADKYGKVSVDVPLVGKLTFSSTDIDVLRQYLI